jgi:hypothetical protein
MVSSRGETAPTLFRGVGPSSVDRHGGTDVSGTYSSPRSIELAPHDDEYFDLASSLSS